MSEPVFSQFAGESSRIDGCPFELDADRACVARQLGGGLEMQTKQLPDAFEANDRFLCRRGVETVQLQLGVSERVRVQPD